MTSTDRIREQMDAIGARDIAQIRASTITGGPACADCGLSTVHGRTALGAWRCRDTETCGSRKAAATPEETPDMTEPEHSGWYCPECESETPHIPCDGCKSLICSICGYPCTCGGETSAGSGSAYVADPANPTGAEIDAAIQRSLAAGTLIDAGDWMARELGTQHGSEDTAPYGDLDDAGSGDLMTALGETGETGEDNYGYRVGLLNAYREAWEKAAGRFYPIGG